MMLNYPQVNSQYKEFSKKGLKNNGANCFVNCFLQMFFNNHSLIQTITSPYLYSFPEFQKCLTSQLAEMAFSKEDQLQISKLLQCIQDNLKFDCHHYQDYFEFQEKAISNCSYEIGQKFRINLRHSVF